MAEDDDEAPPTSDRSPFDLRRTQNNPISRALTRGILFDAASRGSWRAQLMLAAQYAGGNWEFPLWLKVGFYALLLFWIWEDFLPDWHYAWNAMLDAKDALVMSAWGLD